ncbi:EamA family transporter, partial [Meiothermus taiwanensis]|uniref:EamA family transporter n=4 Tax=Meiothermus taiwanensis TaxID=172827 RepID=UPI001CBBFD2A
MSPELLAVSFALLSAISWGAGDFSGGVAARRLNPYLIALLVHATGLLLFTLLALLRGEAFQPSDIPWSVGAGLAGCVGLVFLYRAFEAGQMGLAAPMAGVVGAGLAALVGFVLEGHPTPSQLLGFGVGLLGVWLAARPDGASGPSRGLVYAFLAGLGFGGYFTLIHQVEGLFWPSALAKLTATTLMLWLVGGLGLLQRTAGLIPNLPRGDTYSRIGEWVVGLPQSIGLKAQRSWRHSIDGRSTWNDVNGCRRCGWYVEAKLHRMR